MEDVTNLREDVEELELEPVDLVTGSVELLNEVSAGKITGEEDRYSHTDLYDINANVEGSEAAFEELKPEVAGEDIDPRERGRARASMASTRSWISTAGRRLGLLRGARRGGPPRPEPEGRRPRRAPLPGRAGARRRLGWYEPDHERQEGRRKKLSRRDLFRRHRRGRRGPGPRCRRLRGARGRRRTRGTPATRRLACRSHRPLPSTTPTRPG